MSTDDRRHEAPGQAPGAVSDTPATLPARLACGMAVLIRWWAILGGLVVCAISLMTAYSASQQLLFSAPFAPAYELTKLMIGVAIFAFLPYCQLTGANVTVDIFTEGLSAGKKALMAVLSACFALAFSVLLLRQMSLGLQDYIAFPEVTPILQIPLWVAFPPILVSLALWVAASLISLVDALRVLRGQSPYTAYHGEQISE